MSSPSSGREFKLEDWLVQPQLNTLAHSEKIATIEPKAMQVLVYLAERAGEVVTKDEFFENVWEGAFVTDEALTYSIHELRKALGDDAKKPQYIQTVSRKGYRLIAPVTWETEEPAPTKTETGRQSRWAWAALVAAGILMVVSAGFTVYQNRARQPVVRSLTSYEGFEYDPALSPDGKQVAFTWDGGTDDGESHIYIKLIGGSEPLQITRAPHSDYNPTWSPDGLQIAFQRDKEGDDEILAVPALGGPERRLTTTRTGWGLSWSPDGSLLAYLDKPSSEEPDSIYLLSMDTGEKRRFTFPARKDSVDDAYPRFSPDGSQVAFLRYSRYSGGDSYLYVQPIDSNEARQVLPERWPMKDVLWKSDGKTLLFSGVRESSWETWLFELPLEVGVKKELLFGHNAKFLTYSAAAERLVYSQIVRDINIWRAGGPEADETVPPHKFIASTRDDFLPDYSPDGERLIYLTDREGHWEVWSADADGKGRGMLTYGDHAMFPRWSPSGSRILFHRYSLTEQTSDVLVMDASGSPPRIVAAGGVPSWSADEQWVYYACEGHQWPQVCKIPIDGGDEVQLTRDGGQRPIEAPDGEHVFLTYEDKVWSVPVDGGGKTLVLDNVGFDHWQVWKNTIVYIKRGGPEGFSLASFDLETGESRVFASLGAQIRPNQGLTISPDGKWVLYAQNDRWGSDLMLVEHYR